MSIGRHWMNIDDSIQLCHSVRVFFKEINPIGIYRESGIGIKH